MYNSVSNQNYFEFRGLSSDTKPIGSNCTNKNVDYYISVGSVFFEMDTSKVYMLKIVESTVSSVTTYTGSWVEI